MTASLTSWTVGPRIVSVGQFIFCLRFKDRILDFDENSADDSFANIYALEILFGVFVDPFQDPFAESGKMGPSICVY